jgi:hypothetical protein
MRENQKPTAFSDLEPVEQLHGGLNIAQHLIRQCALQHIHPADCSCRLVIALDDGRLIELSRREMIEQSLRAIEHFIASLPSPLALHPTTESEQARLDRIEAEYLTPRDDCELE